ncbi:beta-1,3-glucanase family protein [Mycolicibacterium austroafricanum]|uniref:beta-1,3-glucanase family protein n=1 Tax=Mycolicibacterium austroafricanum TaxID=39687 RepID=UPI001CA31D2A|nr:beta-1,3-glucanase family protein [Mycolicibacterium austroafricanum]QZT55894.1 hypothetical protein JN084_23610 [Mycolicibacterium austroafricanum]
MDSVGHIAWVGSLAVALGVAGAAASPPAISWAESSDSASQDTSAPDPGEASGDDTADSEPDHESAPSAGESDSADDDSADDGEPVDLPAGDAGSIAIPDTAESDRGNHGDDTMTAAPSEETADDLSHTQSDPDLSALESVADHEAPPAEPDTAPATTRAVQPITAPAEREVIESAYTPTSAAQTTSTAVFAPPLTPAPPSTPVPPVASLAAFASMRRDNEPALREWTTEQSNAAHAAVAAAGGPTPNPVAMASPPAGSIMAAVESMLTAARNWFERTFFAATPVYPPQTVMVTVGPGSASDPFTLTAADADGRALTYSVHGSTGGTGTAAGTLTISGDKATYTPPADWNGETAYTDTFSVTASDQRDGFHIHGLSGLIYNLTFGLLGRAGHSATTTVTVGVRAASTPPGPDPEPPDGPGVPGSFPVSFANNSGYADDEVYVMVIGQVTPGQWSWVDRDGVAHHIDHAAADAPGHLEKDGVNYADMTFTLAEADDLRIPPELLGGRIYVSLQQPLYIAISADDSGWASPDGANPADPNYETVFDWYEMSYDNGSVPFGGNTTQVDQFGFPFSFTVSQDATGFSATRGIALSRREVFSAFEDTVPEAYQALIIRDEDGNPIRILAPRSHQPGSLATWFDEPVDDFWHTYRTTEFVYHGTGYTVTGRVGDDDRFAYAVTAAGGASTAHSMTKPSTADVFRADGPFVGTGLQGAFLAELDAAFNRGVATSPDDWNDVSAYYPAGGRWNDWARFFHAHSLNGFAYGFPYDDVNSQSSVVILNNAEPLTDLRLTLTS